MTGHHWMGSTNTSGTAHAGVARAIDYLHRATIKLEQLRPLRAGSGLNEQQLVQDVRSLLGAAVTSLRIPAADGNAEPEIAENEIDKLLADGGDTRAFLCEADDPYWYL